MATRFDAAADRLYRTANTPAVDGPWTVTFWGRIVTDTDTYSTWQTLSQNDGSTFRMLHGTDSDGTTHTLFENSGTTFATGSALTVGTWYFFRVTQAASAGALTAYLDGGTSADVSLASVSGTGNQRWEFGGLGTVNNFPLNGRIAAIKWWNDVLSVAEQLQERWSYMPVRTNGLQGWYPCLSTADDEIDYSGNGRDFTVAGTLTAEDGPPIQWRQGRRRFLLPAAAAPAGTVPYRMLMGVGT